MLKFVEEQRASQGHDGSYELTDSHGFAYESLSKELCVGNVYLKVYNDQPDFEISEPESFCVALVDFISFLIHGREQGGSFQNNEILINSRDEETEPVDVIGAPSTGQQDNHEDISIAIDEKTTKEDDSLLKNLSFALNSLKVQLFLVKWIYV